MTTTRDRLRDMIEMGERCEAKAVGNLLVTDGRALLTLVAACVDGRHVLLAIPDMLNTSEGQRITTILAALAAITQDDAGGQGWVTRTRARTAA